MALFFTCRVREDVLHSQLGGLLSWDRSLAGIPGKKRGEWLPIVREIFIYYNNENKIETSPLCVPERGSLLRLIKF